MDSRLVISSDPCLWKSGYILLTAGPLFLGRKRNKQVNGVCTQEAFETVSEKQFSPPDSSPSSFLASTILCASRG